jgi:hypothetical protein
MSPYIEDIKLRESRSAAIPMAPELPKLLLHTWYAKIVENVMFLM